jgi:hypothetical protein
VHQLKKANQGPAGTRQIYNSNNRQCREWNRMIGAKAGCSHTQQQQQQQLQQELRTSEVTHKSDADGNASI